MIGPMRRLVPLVVVCGQVLPGDFDGLLLIEGEDGLILVDSGLGVEDVNDPRRLGFQPFRGLWVRSLCAIHPHSAGAGG